MLIADSWKDYELLDCSSGERLERWGDIILIRPDPQVLWDTPKDAALWGRAHAVYERSSKGGGSWRFPQKFKEPWEISWDNAQNDGMSGASSPTQNGGKPRASSPTELRFQLKCMGFKHTGVFPEQAVNWARLQKIIREARKGDGLDTASSVPAPCKVLNLFAYTGAATLACAAAGAHVTHVDAAKGMVQWARENAALSGLSDSPIRWLVDDCGKLVRREIRRGNTYDIIIMDPPSYGRGPGGEVWKLEDEIHALLRDCAALLSENALAFLVNSYTAGLSPSVMAYMLHTEIAAKRGGGIDCDELGLPVSSTGMALPCGASALWAGTTGCKAAH